MSSQATQAHNGYDSAAARQWRPVHFGGGGGGAEEQHGTGTDGGGGQAAVATSVWNPRGDHKQKSYQPVHFDVSKPLTIDRCKDASVDPYGHRQTDFASTAHHTPVQFPRKDAGFNSNDRTTPNSCNFRVPSHPPFSTTSPESSLSPPPFNDATNSFSVSGHSTSRSRKIFTDQPNQRGAVSGYVSDQGAFRSKLVQQDQSRTEPAIGPTSPPPTFRKISQFEKHYGTCVPSNFQTSPLKKRFPVAEPKDSFPTLPARTQSSAQQPVSGRSVSSSPARCNAAEQSGSSRRSKGLEMFFGQRNKHANAEEGYNSAADEDNLLSRLDNKTIEKKIFPLDRMKGQTLQVSEEPIQEPEVVKSSAAIRLLDSEDSDAETVYKARKARKIAVKRTGRGLAIDSSPEHAYDSLLSTDDEGKPSSIRTPVATSQNFLRNLQDDLKKEYPEAQPSNTTVSNLKKITVCSKRAPGRSHSVEVPNIRQEELPSVARKITTASKVKPNEVQGTQKNSPMNVTDAPRGQINSQMNTINGPGTQLSNSHLKTIDSKPITTVSKLSQPARVSEKTADESVHDDITQTDWYKQVFKVLHKLDTELESSHDEDEDHVIPPRPTKSKSAGVSDTEVDYHAKRKDVTSSSTSSKAQTLSTAVNTDTYASDSAISPQTTMTHKNTSKIQLHNDTNKSDKKKSSVAGDKKHRFSDKLLPRPQWKSDDDERICDNSYWLKLGGLENKEPRTETMILHSEGYKSDTEAIFERRLRNREENDPFMESTIHPRHLLRARALFDFIAHRPNELSFRANDVITLTEQIDNNWYHGELYGNVGLVPANYIEVLRGNASQKVSFGGKAVGSTSYSKDDAHDSHWYEGQLGSCKELYPYNRPLAYASKKTKDHNNFYDQENENAGSSPRSSSPLSSSQSTSAALMSPNYETDADLDQLIFDALLAIEDALPQPGKKRDRLAHLPTNPYIQSAKRPASAQPTYPAVTLVSQRSTQLPAYPIKSSNKSSTNFQPPYSSGRSNKPISCQPFLNNQARSFPAQSVQSARDVQRSPTYKAHVAKEINTPYTVNPSYQTHPSMLQNVCSEQYHSRMPQTGRPVIHFESKPKHATQRKSATKQDYPQMTRIQRNVGDPGIIELDISADPWQPQALSKSRKFKDDFSRENRRYDGELIINDNMPRGGTPEKSAQTTLSYVGPWYYVLYDYKPQHDDELDLRQGDLIYLLEKCDDGWCVGHAERTNKLGTFPGNYVTKLVR